MNYKVHWIIDGLVNIEAETKEEAEKKKETPRKSVQAAINEANLLEDAGLGPYRKVGMHIPKVKLFSKKDNQLNGLKRILTREKSLKNIFRKILK